MRKFLFAILIIAGVFWWFAPQTARQRTSELGRDAAAQIGEFVDRYREPVWNRLLDVADMVREKAMALIRTQLHRAVDETVQ